MIQKLLIANRGEIACRIMRTCMKMGIETVAVYSDADKTALHVKSADEAVRIGSAAAADSYLNMNRIIEAAQYSGANAVHPGYGFLAENADFARTVVEAGLTWVGPAPDVIKAMGNKLEAKKLLQDVPYVPGYIGVDQSDEALIAAANDIGYPIMIKAAAGGGGRGMRLIENAAVMKVSLTSARREAVQAFGDGSLILEKALLHPRHIEVQIIGDKHERVIALGERECSIQRRHQKIIEETPAHGLQSNTRNALLAAAVRIGQQLNYVSAGTVEFLLDNDGNFYFMEMNTRLQVEHPVTEMVYGIDLVQWQLEIAQGTPLTQLIADSSEVDTNPQPQGHAIEARIYAEDPGNGFLPVAGKILRWKEPETVRVDTGIQSGDVVETHYDPMVAKIIAHGHNRLTAIRKLDHALARLQLLGIRNNIDFLRRVVTHPDHLNGKIDTRFLEDNPDLLSDETKLPAYAVIAAALVKHDTHRHWRNNPNRPIRHQFASANGNNEVYLKATANNQFEIMLDSGNHIVECHKIADGDYRLTTDGHQRPVTVIEGDHDMWFVHTTQGTYHLKWLSPLPMPTGITETQGTLRAPMPGQIIAVLVTNGQPVVAGDTLIVLEAMKMEHRIKAPYSGIIETISFKVGDVVQQDSILVSVNPSDSEQMSD